MAAVYLDHNANAWWYEDDAVGPMDRLRVQGLERVPVPVTRIQPLHIVEVEASRREGRPCNWDRVI